MVLAILLIGLAIVVIGYAFIGYPIILVALARRHSQRAEVWPNEWPMLTITLPVYNEAASIKGTLEQVLTVDYPADRRHVLVISDASTDGTDEIVQRYADRGVRLIRLSQRRGKTAAENAARDHLRGDFVVNIDATARIAPDALKQLMAQFRDPEVGVASGRDVSVGDTYPHANVGEFGYVGYEMWVRMLETRAGGIVGASGCFYATRKELHMDILPEALSRDFAAPLIARQRGYRSLSVNDAVCFVPRATSLRREYRRKVRTMTRGLQTLYYKRSLLSIRRYGRFAFMLISHKLVRWLVPWAALVGGFGLGIAAIAPGPARTGFLVGTLLAATIMALGWWWPGHKPLPSGLAIPCYIVWGLVASIHAWIRAFRREVSPTWEPTRRRVP